ncbi:hypothetical protein [Limimaricola sp.]|uniref:hypothetical protein n=1 Tax=Limimaricola sp. TaxID=2211665 RepID=UPI004058DC87
MSLLSQAPYPDPPHPHAHEADLDDAPEGQVMGAVILGALAGMTFTAAMSLAGYGLFSCFFGYVLSTQAATAIFAVIQARNRPRRT